LETLITMSVEQPPFSRRLQRLRQAAKLTQEELSRRTGLSVSLIAQMERGRTDDPKLSTLRSLAKVLGVTWEALQGPVKDEEPTPEELKPRRRKES
jgi:transcriptional regulator with XRE-family HTH domain